MALSLIVVPSGMAAAPGHPAVTQVERFVVYGIYTREQRSQLVAEGYDIGEAYWADHVELYGPQWQARALALRGFRVEQGPQTEGIDDFPPGDEGYHTYAEQVTDLQALAAAHPQTVHIITVGQSYEGRNLIGVRISDDATDNLSEPGVFYVGQHHAREHLTPEVVLSIAHLFAESSKVTIGNLVHTRQIYVFPSLNPDGAEYDIAGGSYHFWRKNRQPNQDAVGTDNNRNYTYRWGCCGGSDGYGGGETYRGKAVILAMGSAYRYLGLPNEERLLGHGVSACATCDGFFFRNQRIAVVGGGDSAMEEATFLTRFAEKVYLIHRRDAFRASRIMVDRALANDKIEVVYNTVVEDVLGDDKVSGLAVRNVVSGEGSTLDVTGMFVAIGHDPRSELVRGQVDLDPAGYVLVDAPSTRTNLAGVFACGDLVDHTYRQAITAAGTGCAAALDAERWLEAQLGTE